MPDKKTINERIIRFSGSACIEKELELGEDVTFIIKGGVVKTEKKDNQDETFDKVFIVKLVTAEEDVEE